MCPFPACPVLMDYGVMQQFELTGEHNGCANQIFSVDQVENFDKLTLSSVDLSNEKTTSPKGRKDLAPVSFSIKNQRNTHKTMIKSMCHYFSKETWVKCCKLN